MRLANHAGRAAIVTDQGLVDVARASGGRFPHDPDEAVGRIGELLAWFEGERPEHRSPPSGPLGPGPEFDPAGLLARGSPLGPPVTRPSQVFAIGLNYRAHAAETGMELPERPMVFTKFPSAIAAPFADVPLPTATCDWEVELVVVIGTGGRHIPPSRALAHVAGFCVGQDVSERTSQMAGRPAQFSLAKSHQAFGPVGPWITTLDELADPGDLAISCSVDGETVQSSRTSDHIFGVAALVSHLSAVCELRAGDLVFTGTPSGIGHARTPPRYLTPGAVVTSTIEGLGTIANRCVRPAAAAAGA